MIWHIDTLKDQTDEGYPGQSGWPGNGRHYKVALLPADGDYDLENDVNGGDAGDVYPYGSVNSIGPGPNVYPNTDSYQGGTISQTGVTISNIQSGSGDNMQFRYTDSCPQGPTPAPTAWGCDADEIAVELEFLTDDWGDTENTFTLVSTTTGATIWSEGTFGEQESYYYRECLQANQCYTLDFDDTYGDGFIDGGWLKWTIDGVVQYNSGDFGYGYVDDDIGYCSPTDTPVGAPTDAPVASPTDAPVPAPTSPPVGGVCKAWCEGNTSPWSTKCTWTNCGGCTACGGSTPTDAPVATPTDAPVASPTDAPVEAPTDAPVAPPTGNCSSWCPSNGQPWSTKCAWNGCSGCSECGGSTPTDAPVATPTDAPVAAPTDAPVGGMCKAWCAGNTQPWSSKCAWANCAGCSQC